MAISELGGMRLSGARASGLQLVRFGCMVMYDSP